MSVFSCASDSVALGWIIVLEAVDAGASPANTDAADGTEGSCPCDVLWDIVPALTDDGVATSGAGRSLFSLSHAASQRTIADAAMKRFLAKVRGGVRICTALSFVNGVNTENSGLWYGIGCGLGYELAVWKRRRHIRMLRASVGLDAGRAQRTTPGLAVILVLRHAGKRSGNRARRRAASMRLMPSAPASCAGS